MGRPLVVGISGNLSAPSRTLGLVANTVERIAGEAGAVGRTIDLSLLDGLGDLRRRPATKPEIEEALQAVEAADLLVVGSPVYKGSYTGLFKHFVDFIDYRALAGTPVALLATGGSERHALVIEYQLRPLFAFFQAHTLPTGLLLTDKDLVDGEIVDVKQKERHEQLVREAVSALPGQGWAQRTAEAAE